MTKPAALFSLLTCVAVLYALTFPQNMTEAEDALYYAFNIRSGAADWHPNHLLYEPVNAALIGVLRGALPNLPVIGIMQGANLVCALIALALLYVLIDRSGVGRLATLAAVISVAVSFSYWLYAMMPDTYAMPLAFALGALAVVQAAGLKLHADPAARIGSHMLVAGMLAAGATLMHQQQLFLALAIPLAVVFLTRGPAGLSAGRVVGPILLFWGVFGAVVAIAYLYVSYGVLGHDTLAETVSWARGHARDGLWTPLAPTAPIKSAVGLATAIWAPYVLFSHPVTGQLIQTLFPGKLLMEEVFVLADAAIAVVWFLIACLVVAVIALTVLVARAVWTVCARTAGDTAAFARSWTLALLGCYLLIHAAVITIWEPTNKEFWIACLPAFFGLVFILVPLSKLWRLVTVGLLVPTVLANSIGAMIPFTSAKSDYWRQVNGYVIDTAAPGDVFLTNCSYVCLGYLRYYSAATILPLDRSSADTIAATLTGAQNARVLLSSWLWQAPVDAVALGTVHDKARKDADIQATRDRLTEVHRNPDQTIYVLDAQAR